MAKKTDEQRIASLRKKIARKDGDAPRLQRILDKLLAKTSGTTENNVSSDIREAATDADYIAGRSLDFGRGIADEFVPQGSFGTPLDATTSPAMQAFLDRLNSYSQTAGQLTPMEQEALNNLRAGLGGYTGQETQGMREAAMQEINRQAQTQSRLAQIAQSRSGVRGASALAQQQNIGREQQQNVGNFERDLLIRNADEIQRRRQAFSDTVRGTEDARFGRQSTANQQYGGFLGAEEAARTGREQYNNALGANEAMARAGTALGGAGTYTGLLTGQQATDFQQQQAEWLRQFQERMMKMQQEQAQQYYDIANKQIAATQASAGV